MTTTALLETLTTEQSTYARSMGGANEARAESRLLDAAIDCGMAWDHDDLHGWVAQAVTDFLTSGPSIDDDDWGDEGIGRDEFGRWEYVA